MIAQTGADLSTLFTLLSDAQQAAHNIFSTDVFQSITLDDFLLLGGNININVSRIRIRRISPWLTLRRALQLAGLEDLPGHGHAPPAHHGFAPSLAG